MKHKKILLMLICSLCLSSCTTSIPYNSDQFQTKDPIYIITKVLKEQPQQFAPMELEVKDDFFEIKRNRQIPVTVYYESIGNVEIYKKRSLYYILIRDNANIAKLWTFTFREDQAKLFATALLQQRNKFK